MKSLSYCSSCGAPIIWATHTISRKSAPIDATPSADGTIRLLGSEWGIVPPETRPDFAGQLHKDHFATCPNADQHSRKSR